MARRAVGDRRDPPARDRMRADPDPMVLVTGRPRLKSERLDAPLLSRVRDLLGHAVDDHAPADSPDRVDAVDLECRPYRAEQGEQLESGPGADQHRLRRFVEDVVDRPYHRLWPMGGVDCDPAKRSFGEQSETFGSIELEHLGRATRI